MKQASKVTLLFQDIYSQTYLKTNKQDQFKKKKKKQNKTHLFVPQKAQLQSHKFVTVIRKCTCADKCYNLTLQMGPYGKAPCPLRPTAKSEEP